MPARANLDIIGTIPFNGLAESPGISELRDPQNVCGSLSEQGQLLLAFATARVEVSVGKQGGYLEKHMSYR